jgi:hypothetical protein
MPKLEIEHLIQKLQKRTKQLENGKLLEARDINVLLNVKQLNDLKNYWSKQQALRKTHKTPITEQDKKRIGWKTIREVRLDILNKALVDANDSLLGSFEKRLKALEVKRDKIYMKEVNKNIKDGVDKTTAALRANNELIRHGLQKIDRMRNNKLGFSKRDREIREMEDDLRKRVELEDKKK